MAENKNPSFTVTDRRLFTADGELRKNAPEEEPKPEQQASEPEKQQTQPAATAPEAPSASEQKKQADAYHKSSAEMDREVERSGNSAKDLEITF